MPPVSNSPRTKYNTSPANPDAMPINASKISAKTRPGNSVKQTVEEQSAPSVRLDIASESLATPRTCTISHGSEANAPAPSSSHGISPRELISHAALSGSLLFEAMDSISRTTTPEASNDQTHLSVVQTTSTSDIVSSDDITARDSEEKPPAHDNVKDAVHIRDLHPFLANPWVLEARVVSCAEPRDWTTERGTGKFLSCYIIDVNGDIAKVTIFNDAVDTFQSLVVDGSCCSFSGGYIRFANKAFSRDPYEISFDDRSAIASVPPARIPVAPLRLRTTIADIGRLMNKNVVTVLGIATMIGGEKRIATKRGQETAKRELLLADHSSHQIVCVLWGNHAKGAISGNKGKVVLIRNAEINDYNGNRSLNIGPQTALMFNPSLEEVHKLSQWFDAQEEGVQFPFVETPIANIIN